MLYRLILCLSFALQAPPPEKKERQPRIWNLKPHLKPQMDVEQRNPQLPTSVPMPCCVDDIHNAGMRAMWEGSGSEGAAPAAVDPLD